MSSPCRGEIEPGLCLERWKQLPGNRPILAHGRKPAQLARGLRVTAASVGTGPLRRFNRSPARPATGPSTVMSMAEDAPGEAARRRAAADRYRPTHVSLLIVAHAPPQSGERYFYFEQVREKDDLFRYVVKGLFGAVPERSDKAAWLGRLRDAGVFLIDLLERPYDGSDLASHVPGLVDRVRELDPDSRRTCECRRLRRRLPIAPGLVCPSSLNASRSPAAASSGVSSPVSLRFCVPSAGRHRQRSADVRLGRRRRRRRPSQDPGGAPIRQDRSTPLDCPCPPT